MREREKVYIFPLTLLGAQIFVCEVLFPTLRGIEPSEALGLHLFSPQPWHLWHFYEKTDLLEVSFSIKILRWQIYGLTFEPKECDFYSFTLWAFCSHRKLNKNVSTEMYVMFSNNWSISERGPSFVVRSITDVESLFVRGVTLKQEWVN
jgi:hypothetical protein